MKPLETPLAFIIFNRPDTTERVFNEIRRVQPKKLFVISDGPRNETERLLVEETRSIIDRVDWDCSVEKNYSDVNLGCKKRVSSGLDWFFEHVEEGIILEDDCVPTPSFFPFCEEMLAQYRTDERVMMITGDNFLPESLQPVESYYFSRHSNIWGWATWRRAWKHYDVAMKTFPGFKKNGDIRAIWSDPTVAEYWMKVFDHMYKNKVDTWDYQWAYAMWRNRGFEIVPRVNLISNIGFDGRATHTKKEGEPLANLPTKELPFPLVHPALIEAHAPADEYINRHLLRIQKPSTKKSIFKKLWTSSPQALYAKLRGVLHLRKTAAPTKVIGVRGGYARGVKLMLPDPIPRTYASMAEGTYEDFILKALQKHTTLADKVVWDVGAHIGYQSFSFASLGARTIVAFEPNPHNVATFKRNLELNPEFAKRIMILPDALSDKEGSVAFNVSASESDATTSGGYLGAVTPPLPDSSYEGFSSIQVHTATIDALVVGKLPLPDVIKIDVEGAELAVLQGGAGYIEKNKPMLIVEIHTIPMMLRVERFLRERGYSVEVLDEQEGVFTKNILATPLSQ